MLLSLEKAIFSWLGHYVGESTMCTKTVEYISMRLVKSSKQNVPVICLTLCSDAGELGNKSSKEDAALHEQCHHFSDKRRGTRRWKRGRLVVGKWAALDSVLVAVTACGLRQLDEVSGITFLHLISSWTKLHDPIIPTEIHSLW